MQKIVRKNFQDLNFFPANILITDPSETQRTPWKNMDNKRIVDFELDYLWNGRDKSERLVEHENKYVFFELPNLPGAVFLGKYHGESGGIMKFTADIWNSMFVNTHSSIHKSEVESLDEFDLHWWEKFDAHDGVQLTWNLMDGREDFGCHSVTMEIRRELVIVGSGVHQDHLHNMSTPLERKLVQAASFRWDMSAKKQIDAFIVCPSKQIGMRCAPVELKSNPLQVTDSSKFPVRDTVIEPLHLRVRAKRWCHMNRRVVRARDRSHLYAPYEKRIARK